MKKHSWVWQKMPLSILRVVCLVLGHRWHNLGEIEVPAQIIQLDGSCRMENRMIPARLCLNCCLLDIEDHFPQQLEKGDLQ